MYAPFPPYWMQYAYETRQREGVPWKEVGERMGIGAQKAEKMARHHATNGRLPWPLPCTVTLKTTHKRPIHRDAYL